tara:strand:- start:171 stop:809 length:639 start_codon:yes stop_codon:yes gene_type:complete
MNQLIPIEASLPTISGIITGSDISGVQDNTIAELDIWDGMNEHDPIMKPTLDAYWDGYWWSGDPNVPWSAVFISYLLKNDGLKGSPQHLQYVKNVIAGESPDWTAYSIPKNQRRIQLNIGDVVIKPRQGGDTNTHGDIIYKIENGIAYLAGGNVPDHAKLVGTFSVDESGTVTHDIFNYLVILKKKPSLLPNKKFLFPLALAGIGLIWWTQK